MPELFFGTRRCVLFPFLVFPYCVSLHTLSLNKFPDNHANPQCGGASVSIDPSSPDSGTPSNMDLPFIQLQLCIRKPLPTPSNTPTPSIPSTPSTSASASQSASSTPTASANVALAVAVTLSKNPAAIAALSIAVFFVVIGLAVLVYYRGIIIAGLIVIPPLKPNPEKPDEKEKLIT